MPNFSVAFFLEDVGQEAIIPPLFTRIAVEEGIPAEHLDCRVLHSRGGGSLAAYENFLRDLHKSRHTDADLLIVGSDGNCNGFATRRDQVLNKAKGYMFTEVIAAVPDPHVERWYLLDVLALEQAAGVRLSIQHIPEKCEKDYYKKLLRQAFEGSEITPPLGGIEYGERVAQSMNLYNAGKQDHGFAEFVNSSRAWLRRQIAVGVE